MLRFNRAPLGHTSKCLALDHLGIGTSTKRISLGYLAFRAGMESLHIRGGDTTIAARLISTGLCIEVGKVAQRQDARGPADE